MDHAWTASLEAPGERWHAVQIYSHPGELADSLATYVAAGITLGEPALIVVRPAHYELVVDRLAAAGWDANVLLSVGLLVVLDAEQTLDALLDDAVVAPAKFEDVIGGALDAISANFPGRNIRTFGEMVDVLCNRGDNAGAAQLEELWNEAANARRFSLLCGYRLDVFDRTAQFGALPGVCRAHTQVKAAEHAGRFDHAVQSALVDVLGPTHARMVYGMVAEDAHNGTPLPQHALMWVSDHMPALSERILTTARARYGASAEAAA